MGELPGYARVSTLEQNADLQRAAVSAAGCRRVFTDHVAGVRDRRPELDRVLEGPGPGDTLVVWRLDRLGRSLRHLIEVATELGGRGVSRSTLYRALTKPGGVRPVAGPGPKR